MNRNPRNSLPALLLVLAVAAWAEDPWKSKPASEWTKKEVEKILNNSPWTQVITAPTSWARTGGEKWEVGPGPVRIGKGATVEVNPDRSDDMGRFLLRWESSRTIREALAREAELKGLTGLRVAAPDKKSDQHVIVLIWDPFVLQVPKATEAEAARNATIKPRMLDAEFNAARVEYRREWNGRLNAVAFYFNKKTAGERDIIDGDEDRVDFAWHVRASTIQGRFNPRKMTARGKRDLD